MQSNEIYFDNNANTRILPEAQASILEAIALQPGNPSSGHSAGDRCREIIGCSRESVASLIGADAEQVFFTSGATESNNTILFHAFLEKPSGRRIITSTVEHPSVLAVCAELERRGATVVYVPVSSDGLVDMSRLQEALTASTAIVSIQWVNHETGVVQPVDRIGEICRCIGVPFHTDAAQAVGKMEVFVGNLPIDYLSLSAHKFNGPCGVGALYSKRGAAFRPLILGGGQEHQMRSGTENLIGIAGLGAAAEARRICLHKHLSYLRTLRDTFEKEILAAIPDVCPNGDAESRVCNTSSLRFAAVDGQALVARLDQEGIRCSQSSACTSQRPEPSHVLLSMGLSEEAAYSSVRFSFGLDNNLEQVHRAVGIIRSTCDSLRAFSRLRVQAD